jgi:hypothetical protein
VQGESLRPLLTNPAAPWDRPALTTYRFMNHTVRAEGWRYIRYADGGEELYDETRDPYEWTNLASKPDFATRKAELSRWLPQENKPEMQAARAAGAEGGRPLRRANRANRRP